MKKANKSFNEQLAGPFKNKEKRYSIPEIITAIRAIDGCKMATPRKVLRINDMHLYGKVDVTKMPFSGKIRLEFNPRDYWMDFEPSFYEDFDIYIFNKLGDPYDFRLVEHRDAHLANAEVYIRKGDGETYVYELSLIVSI